MVEPQVMHLTRLSNPGFEKPFILQTSTSDIVLSQKDEDDKNFPVAYFRKNFLLRQQKFVLWRRNT